MSDVDHAKVLEIGDAVHKAIRKAVAACGPATKTEMLHGVTAALAMLVAYSSAQEFLNQLAVCIDAKEHVRAIEAGEVPDVH